MIKRVNISVSDEEHKQMKQLALDMGMSVSQIIQRCFFKLAHDEKMRAIIKRGEFTSHNVRYEQQKRSDEADPDSSSLEPLTYSNTLNYAPGIDEKAADAIAENMLMHRFTIEDIKQVYQKWGWIQ